MSSHHLHPLLTPVRKPVQLRYSSSDLLFVPKVNTSIGVRDVAVGAPTRWNMLSSSIESVENIAKIPPSFKDIPLLLRLCSMAYQSI